MRTIGITYEITRRYYKEIEITDEQYSRLTESCNPWEADINVAKIMQADTEESGYESSDYSITDDEGCTIVDWE